MALSSLNYYLEYDYLDEGKYVIERISRADGYKLIHIPCC